MGKYSNYTSHSSFWLKDWEDDEIIVSNFSQNERKSHDLYKMANVRRAISNFVNIVTNKSIPVKFNTRGNSYTDGTTVVIGADVIEPKDFDVAVGLALHEGSHIKLSDFQLLQNIYSLVPKDLVDSAIKKGILNPIGVIKDLWNYVEDRRIDNFIFSSAPGYREYYRAMYDKYFNDSIIDKGLTSDEYTEESVESYMFRIINLHNKNTNLSKLKGLREIYKLIGLGSISRLKSSQDTFNVAIEVFNVILNSLPNVNQNQNSDQSQSSNNGENGDSENSENTNGSSEMSGDMDSNEMGGGGMSMDSQMDISGEPSQSNSNSSSNKNSELSNRQKELLRKKIEKQKDFLNGKISKKSINKSEEQSMNAIEESGSEIQAVGEGLKNRYGHFQKGTQCIVVNKLTKSLMNTYDFPLTRSDWKSNEPARLYSNEVREGIAMGTILGKKLQVRGESRTTIYNRQKVGKIDKRLISTLGFGNENVFSVFETDSYKRANLHISIDASGSMGGEKWRKTIINVVGLCKAVDMISNLSIQISVRTTSNTGIPYVVMAYDSRVDKFNKAKYVFECLTPNGSTPEGLCFEGILKNFIPAGNDFDSYFLNISDGEPYFEGKGFSYCYDVAYNHTKSMVKKIEDMGIKTLSYFVSDVTYSTSSEPSRGFKMMYGKGAKFIDVKSIPQITKTMNEMFLNK